MFTYLWMVWFDKLTTSGLWLVSRPVLLEELAEILRSRYEIAEVRWHRKPSASRPADPAAVADLALHCDSVIIAVGD